MESIFEKMLISYWPRDGSRYKFSKSHVGNMGRKVVQTIENMSCIYIFSIIDWMEQGEGGLAKNSSPSFFAVGLEELEEIVAD